MEQAVRALRLVRDEVSNSRKQSEEQHTRLQVVQAEKVALEEAVRKLASSSSRLIKAVLDGKAKPGQCQVVGSK